MNLPIVLIHQGNSRYLKYSLAQARETNPQSDIFLIGDSANSYYENINQIKHINMFNYFNRARDFAKVYQHYSPNPFNFELFCFQRWFILNEFMLSNNIKKAFYMDSDVMLYTSILEEEKNFAQFDFAEPCAMGSEKPTTGNHIFINNLEKLNDFCNFIWSTYTEEYYLKLREHRVEAGRKKNPKYSESDMTAFQQYFKKNLAIGGCTTTIINNTVFDRNINVSDGFEIKNKIKNIYWINNQPFCKHSSSGEEIRFKNLHFQGLAKKYMKDYCTIKGIKWINFWVQFRFMFLLRKGYFKIKTRLLGDGKL